MAEVEVLCGEEGVKRIDRSGARHGLLARLIRLAQFAGEEQVHLQRHEQELRAGHLLIAVPVGTDENAKQQARDIPVSHGGHYVKYYGRFVTEDL